MGEGFGVEVEPGTGCEDEVELIELFVGFDSEPSECVAELMDKISGYDLNSTFVKGKNFEKLSVLWADVSVQPIAVIGLCSGFDARVTDSIAEFKLMWL